MGTGRVTSATDRGRSALPMAMSTRASRCSVVMNVLVKFSISFDSVERKHLVLQGLGCHHPQEVVERTIL